MKASTEDLGQTIITAEIEVRGNMNCLDPLLFNGKITGNIESSSDVVIGPSAIVSGNIQCRNLTLGGQLIGKAEVSHHLTINDSGQLFGDVNTMELTVFHGGKLVGSITMPKAKS